MNITGKLTLIQLYFMFDNFDFDSIVRIIGQRDEVLYEGIYGETNLFDELEVDNFCITSEDVIEIVIK